MEILSKLSEFIDVEAFIASLPYMGKGMLGIFIVTAVVVLAVNALNTLPDKDEE